ncbi:MAG TPA: hypothetical protein VND65_16115 [Candidatus Binatia bacterium]|nr:hypothetical protein [Candidatus Binatia bacterium]
MYTGTLIHDLAALVERAEKRASDRRKTEELELQRMFELEIAELNSRELLAGAA